MLLGKRSYVRSGILGERGVAHRESNYILRSVKTSYLRAREKRTGLKLIFYLFPPFYLPNLSLTLYVYTSYVLLRTKPCILQRPFKPTSASDHQPSFFPGHTDTDTDTNLRV